MDMTPEKYIALTIKMTEELVPKLAEAFAGLGDQLESADPEKAMEIVMGALLELRKVIGGDLLPEGVTDEDMMAWEEEHKAEIEEYLTTHPELKEKMDKLEAEFQSQMPG